MKVGRIFFTLAALNLSGCAQSTFRFQQEPLTGEEYGEARFPLGTVDSSSRAHISFKYTQDDAKAKAPVQARLLVVQRGKEYRMHKDETLKLSIDGISYPLTKVHSLQDPLEVVHYYTMPTPSGILQPGVVQEVTRRHWSFLIDRSHFLKMVTARKIIFEISCSKNLPGYPVILELHEDEREALHEFQNRCVSNFLRQQETNK